MNQPPQQVTSVSPPPPRRPFWRKALRLLVRIASAFLATAICLALLIELSLRLLVTETLIDIPLDRSETVYNPDRARKHPHAEEATNALRIAIVGDSIAMGGGNQRCDRFGDRLEWLLNLNEGVAPVVVDTYAKPSATYQQLGMLEEALANKPSIIVLAAHLNDLEDWSQPQPLLERRARTNWRSPPHWLRPAIRRSLCLRAAYLRLETLRQCRAWEKYYHMIFKPGYSGRTLFRNAIKRAHAACRTNDCAMVVVLFPTMSHEMAGDRYPFGAYHADFARLCREEGLPFLDLLDSFRCSSLARLHSVYMIDDHPSEIGHRLAAEAIFRFLSAENLIDPAYHPHRKTDETLRRIREKKARVLKCFLLSPEKL